MGKEVSIGLALGAGGANGLAHIAMLEAFDELGLRPAGIAGSSIGAIIGSLYASGNTAREIRTIVEGLVGQARGSWKDLFLNREVFQWIELLDPEIGRGGFLSGESFLSFLSEHIQAASFEDLEIPLVVTAADFWEWEEAVFDSGELLPAIRGSMAMPGIFTPVRWEGRLLVDGGAVNPVPYDLLANDCRLTVAVDVCGRRSPREDISFLDAVFNTFKIMQETIVRAKCDHRPPDIIIKPDIADIRALDFHKAAEIFRLAQPAKDRLKQSLGDRLAAA